LSMVSVAKWQLHHLVETSGHINHKVLQRISGNSSANFWILEFFGHTVMTICLSTSHRPSQIMVSFTVTLQTPEMIPASTGNE
jgi:hypothetical protein